ncbi:MAG TPA: enolase C-terminal domain-like protein [Dactylosporangium sp.]|nr:enolase C-terminal domain-like protein [Dactylosporangium sp.]
MAAVRDGRLIEDVRCRAVEVPLLEPFAIAGGAPSAARNVFVRVALRDGTVGYGEAAPFEAVSGETQAGTLAAAEAAARLLPGRDVAQWRALHAELRPRLAAAPAALCGIEQALFDALARHAGLPLVDLFGGRAGPLRTDVTIPAGDAEHARRSARRAAAEGFATLKVKTGAAGWESDVARLLAIRDAAPEAGLIVDANGGYTFDDARAFLAALDRAGVRLRLFEQPVPADRPERLRDLEGEFGVPVCADESVRSPADALRIAAMGGVSALNVKLMKFGVVDALDVLAIARSAGMTCMIGGMVETAASMSFSAALAEAMQPLCVYVDLDTPLFMPPGIIAGGLRYSGDAVTLPPAPGTGVDLEPWF